MRVIPFGGWGEPETVDIIVGDVYQTRVGRETRVQDDGLCIVEMDEVVESGPEAERIRHAEEEDSCGTSERKLSEGG